MNGANRFEKWIGNKSGVRLLRKCNIERCEPLPKYSVVASRWASEA